MIKISRILRLNVCVGPGNIMDTLLKGKVCNLYIDRKRDKNGYRYGFARFVGIQNDLDFSRKLDAINAGSMKLHVNIPRFAIVGGLGAEKKEREYAEKEKGNKLRKKNLKEERGGS